MLAKLVGHTIGRVEALNAKHHPAADTAAVVTIAAVADRQHFLHGVQWSYSTDPTGGSLTIAVNGVTVWKVDIVSGGPGGFGAVEIPSGTNEAIVVTLATGTGACVGKVNVQYSTESPRSN